MKAILCADPKNGLLFNRRRQSQDRELRKHILSIIGDEKLYVSAYSAGQFTESSWKDRLLICEDPAEAAAAGAAFYFAEGQPLRAAAEEGQLDAVILFRWDKVYPADTYLDLPLTEERAGEALNSAEMSNSAETSDGSAASNSSDMSDGFVASNGSDMSDGFVASNSSDAPARAGEAAGSWRLAAKEDLAGYSHEKITKETYIKG